MYSLNIIIENIIVIQLNYTSYLYPNVLSRYNLILFNDVK